MEREATFELLGVPRGSSLSVNKSRASGTVGGVPRTIGRGGEPCRRARSRWHLRLAADHATLRTLRSIPLLSSLKERRGRVRSINRTAAFVLKGRRVEEGGGGVEADRDRPRRLP